jgi:acetyltransferase
MRRAHIECLLNPRSIAVVGANDRGNSGARTVKGALASGFSGPVYPINPKYEQLEGVRCYASLGALPEVPDVVVVSVPTDAALGVLREGAEAGVRAMVFYSGGFNDAGTPEGQARQREMVEIAASSGMLVGGPNCMGIMSLKRRFNASFVSTPGEMKAGGISIVSQSGGLINAFMELGYARGLGFNYVISAGNEAVLHSADHLDWLTDDEDTSVVVCCLESVKDGVAFRAALAKATAVKPVIILKLGRSDAGQQATLAHTGNLAGSDDVFAALCAKHGVTLVETIDQALETAAMFDRLPLPKGDGTVIFSTSGGATVLSTDIATRLGMTFPALSPATNARMQEIYGAKRPFINPFDVGSYPLMAKGQNMTETLRALIADPGVHAMACVMVVQREQKANRMGLFEQVKAVCANSSKPFAILPEATYHWRDFPPDIGAHVAASLHDGLFGLKALGDYARYRRTVRDAVLAPLPAIALSLCEGRRILTEYESKWVLAEAGLPVTRETLVQTAAEATTAASGIGYPVALKIQSPDLMHKSDAGGVVLGLGDEGAVREAFDRVTAAARASGIAALDGILVQEMVRDGVEVLIGMKRDRVFGPVVVVGAGGVLVDLLADTARLLLLSVDHAEAKAAIAASPALEKLLAGFRGRQVADRDALVKLIVDFAAFVTRLPDTVVAVDLNPVMVLPAGRGAIIVDASIELASDTGASP